MPQHKHWLLVPDSMRSSLGFCRALCLPYPTNQYLSFMNSEPTNQNASPFVDFVLMFVHNLFILGTWPFFVIILKNIAHSETLIKLTAKRGFFLQFFYPSLRAKPFFRPVKKRFKTFLVYFYTFNKQIFFH